MEHDFQIVILPEELLVPLCLGLGLVQPAFIDHARHDARHARGGTNQPLVVTLQQLTVDARAPVEALDMGERDHPQEVVVTRQVLREQNQVVAAAHRAVVPPQARHVGLAPQDGLDALLAACVIKGLQPIEAPVVRDGAGLHPQRLHPLHQRRHLARTVQQRIARVHVQMHERHGRRFAFFLRRFAHAVIIPNASTRTRCSQ